MSSNPRDLKDKLATRAQTAVANKNEIAVTVSSLLSKDSIKHRFEEILGQKAAGFISSVINVTNGSRALKECNPNTIVASAAVAASLDLPIDPNLGFAWIVPYSGEAQFQLGAKGYIQLALRSGQYKSIHVGPVYEGEIAPVTARERLRGELRFSENPAPSDKIIGYAAYFQLLNGAEMWDYMSREEVDAHARRFSKSYNSKSSPWRSDFDAMACKTVMKRLLSHYGILSIEMQTAVKADQAIVRDGEGGAEFDYADNGAVDAAFEVQDRDVDETSATSETQGNLSDLLGK